MDKKKISKKQKALSTKQPQLVTLKAGVKARAWHPTSELLNEDNLGKSLLEALKLGDTEAFKEILTAHLEAKVKTKEAKAHGLSERTLYEALSEKGNPSLNTIAKIVQMVFASKNQKNLT